jgi:hypothetical protein
MAFDHANAYPDARRLARVQARFSKALTALANSR